MMNLNSNGGTRVRTYEAEGDPTSLRSSQQMLPKGRVEAVLLVDEKLRRERPAHAWRIAFDRRAFEFDDDGNPRMLRATIARVSHCLHAMWGVIAAIKDLGLQPVAIRKEEDDQMVVALWRNIRNPQVKEVEVKGFMVRIEELAPAAQAAFSEWMAVVEDVDAFKNTFTG